MHTTAWKHTSLIYWCECGSTIYKTRHATLFLLEWPFFSHQTVSFWYYCIIPISIYTLPSLSVQLLHVDVSLSEHSDQKVRLHALGQTVCQLSASVNPFDLISCWLVKEWIEPVVLPGSHMRLPMCIRYLGSVQAKHTHIYKLFIYTPWCGTSTYAHTK